jgi:hypothetical protein
VVAPPVVQIGGTNSSKPAVTTASAKSNVIAPKSNASEPTVPVATASPVQPTSLPAAENTPTKVANKEVPLPQIPVGATVTLNGKDLSDKPGQVMLQIGEIALPVAIKEWKNDAVICTLPLLGLTKASQATLHVLKADGKTASTMNLELVTALPTGADAR